MGKEEGDGAGVGGWLFGKGVGGPVLFGDVGSQAKDLVYKGFVSGHMLMISCLGPVGSTVTSTASITQDVTVGIVSASFQDGNTKHDLSFDTAGTQINASTTYTNFGVPGVTAGVQTSFPGGVNEGKAHVWSLLNICDTILCFMCTILISSLESWRVSPNHLAEALN
jgi:hypothetical protein